MLYFRYILPPLIFIQNLQFKEFITRLCGKEKTEIPEEVINILLRECRKRSLNPITQPEEITYLRVREFLRQNEFSHFFENIVKLISILTKRPSSELTPQQEQTLIGYFDEIQSSFDRHKGKRKNFLSYSYVTHKFCELLGYDQFLPFLPLLKAPPNLLAADRIWKCICADLGYQFIPTDPDPMTMSAVRTSYLQNQLPNIIH